MQRAQKFFLITIEKPSYNHTEKIIARIEKISIYFIILYTSRFVFNIETVYAPTVHKLNILVNILSIRSQLFDELIYKVSRYLFVLYILSLVYNAHWF